MPEFPCSGPIKVQVSIPAGEVNVTAEERETAVAEVTPLGDSERDRSAAEATQVKMNGDTLSVEAPWNSGWLPWRSGSVRVDVPVSSSARIKAASANVTCHGRYDRVEAKSASGAVLIGDASGDVKVGTASGDIQVGDVGGKLAANSASGDITTGKVGGDAKMNTASGDIRVDAVSGDIQAKSASGDLDVGVISRGDVSVKTISGRVSLGIAPGTGVWMDLSSLSGHIDSTLESLGDAPEKRDLAIKVRTISGAILIARSTEPAAV